MLFLWALVFVLVLQEQDLLETYRCHCLQCKDYSLCKHSSLSSHEEGEKVCHNKVYPDVDEFLKTMRHLKIGVLYRTAADPVSVLPGSLGRGSWCNEHDTIHERLDIIEEKVIKTVEHLESEVKSLLNIISETTSNIPIAPGAPL